MSCQPPRRSPSPDPGTVAFERRVRAAWIDYLETTRTAPRRDYEAIEANAWARLQRRLERNEQRFPVAAR